MADTGSFAKNLSPKSKPSRRMMLQVIGMGAAGFAVGYGPAAAKPAPAPNAKGAKASKAASAAPVVMGPFVRIGADNTVTVLLKHIEFGQGVSTGLTTIVAEELDADWSQMRFEHAPAEVPTYGNLAFGGVVQGTGGSTAIANSWTQLRNAGAAARAMLVQAAAAQWKIDPAKVKVEKGKLTAGKKSATFGELAAAAAKVTPPKPADLKLKDPSKFALIGKERGARAIPNRADGKPKTNGKAQYAMDFHPEGVLVAVVARSPRFGGKVKSFDDSGCKAVGGFVETHQISNGVAVLAKDFWSAKKARDALKVEWDNSAAESRSSDAIMAAYKELAKTPGYEARKEGQGAAGMTGAGKVITADYEFPYLAHAPLEALNCTLVYTPGESCVIHSGSQMPTVDQAVAAGILGLKPKQVTVKTYLAGGSFGRRATPDGDLLQEAAQITKAVNGRAPVKLIWTREDDIHGGRYRPMALHRLSARVNNGKIEAWTNRVVVQSIMEGTPFLPPGQKDASAAEGATDLPYAIDHMSVDIHWPKSPVSVLWWRSVGHTHTGLATEAFLDELATELKADPVELRRSLLTKAPRHLAVLNLAADKAGWGKPLAAGPAGTKRARGVAVHESFGSYVAQVAEVTVKADGSYSVDRIVCAVDCGVAINPDIIRSQMEGGIGYGLSAALGEAVTIKDGAPVQSNFFDYPPLRLAQMPKIEVHIVPSAEAPTGVGEPGLPPAAPAVVNALAAATGKRIRVLPVGAKI